MSVPVVSVSSRIPAGKAVRPRTAGRWWVDVVQAAAVLSVIVVVGLWVSGRGIQDLMGGWAVAATSLGRLTGLVAADLMLLQVAAIARIPWVERTFGQDRLAAWHRLLGFTSVNLMLAHVVLITVGYAGTVRNNVFVQFWDLVTQYPGMLLALAAFAAVVMVALTSIRVARRRLRYESWHLLHLYAYLGVGLALPHQLWAGQDFIGSAAARAYWWTLYGTVAGSVVVFRLGLPAYRSWRHRLHVAAVVPEAAGVVSVYLQGRDLHRMPVRAGQFFVFRFLSGAGWSRAHPFSLSAAPRPDWMRITVKELGDGSAAAAGLQTGTGVLVEGPYGRLTGEHYRGGGVTMLAAGIGLTPLLALLGELPYHPGQAVLVYRASTPQEFLFRSELDALAERRGLRVIYLPGPRAPRRSWLPAEYTAWPDHAALLHLVPDIADHDVYVCGQQEWMTAAEDAVRAAGVPAKHVHSERFAW